MLKGGRWGARGANQNSCNIGAGSERILAVSGKCGNINDIRYQCNCVHQGMKQTGSGAAECFHSGTRRHEDTHACSTDERCQPYSLDNDTSTLLVLQQTPTQHTQSRPKAHPRRDFIASSCNDATHLPQTWDFGFWATNETSVNKHGKSSAPKEATINTEQQHYSAKINNTQRVSQLFENTIDETTSLADALERRWAIHYLLLTVLCASISSLFPGF